MRYVYNCGRIAMTSNLEFYLRVNPIAFEVVKCRGGWRPVQKNRWLGQLPIKAKLSQK